MYKFRFFLFILFSFPVFAAPSNCKPLPIVNTNIQLSTHKPVVIVFHNTSMHNIYVTHPSSGSSLIEPDKWSILALVDEQYELSCVESVPGHEQVVPCGEVLNLCQSSGGPKQPDTTKWLTENISELPEDL